MTQKTTLSFVLIIAIGGLVGSLAAIGVESLFFAITPNHPEKYVGFSFTHDGSVSNTAPPCAGNRQTLCIDSSQGLRFGNEEYFDHTECHLVEMRPKMRGADYDNIVVCE